jgi:molybdenum-dependent DNA-binding transcriptional regulator ModE
MPRAKLRRYFRHGLFPQMMAFEAVARLGSVTRAARELHLAQPTISTHLHKLAETLEVELFRRHGRRLRLTAAGHALRRTCVELKDVLVRADARLSLWRPALLDANGAGAKNPEATKPEVESRQWNYRGNTTRQ